MISGLPLCLQEQSKPPIILQSEKSCWLLQVRPGIELSYGDNGGPSRENTQTWNGLSTWDRFMEEMDGNDMINKIICYFMNRSDEP
jgi:hypothetical protein